MESTGSKISLSLDGIEVDYSDNIFLNSLKDIFLFRNLPALTLTSGIFLLTTEKIKTNTLLMKRIRSIESFLKE